MQDSAAFFGETSTNLQAILFGSALLVILIFYGWYLVRDARRRGWESLRGHRGIKSGEKADRAQMQDLEWYREKRFLMEEQAREKHERIRGLIKTVSPGKDAAFSLMTARLFWLTETIREERQHLGTDLSKLSLIDRRLRALAKEALAVPGKGADAEQWLSELSRCRERIREDQAVLRQSQNTLRSALSEAAQLEETASDSLSVRDVETVEEKLKSLPDNLKDKVRDAGEEAGNLIDQSVLHLPDRNSHEIWKEQLMLEHFSSRHRGGGKEELLEAAAGVLLALQTGSGGLHGGAKTANSDRKEQNPPAEAVAHSMYVEEKPRGAPAGAKGAAGFSVSRPDPGAQFEYQSSSAPGIVGLSGLGPEEESIIPPQPENTEQTVASIDLDSRERFESEDGRELKAARSESETKSEDAMKSKMEEAPGLDDAVWAPPFDSEEVTEGEEEQEEAIFSSFSPETGQAEGIELGDRGESGLDAAEDSDSSEFGEFREEANASAPADLERDESGRYVIFRAETPDIWDSDSPSENGSNLAVPLDKIPGHFEWLGIRRLDTGEEVFLRSSPEELRGNGEGKPTGFNGSNEYFYGARHLGFFSEDCPPEVETRFTYGGWGFGHLSTGFAEDSDEPDVAQACGWEGKAIPGGAVFEFAVYKNLPPGISKKQVIGY